MEIKVGCEFDYEVIHPTAAVLQVQPREDGPHHVREAVLRTTPELPMHAYHDVYGNLCQRVNLPPGPLKIYYDARVEVSSNFDDVHLDAPQMAITDLPDETLLYTLPSRYCLSDLLGDAAWKLFGNSEPGFRRVQAISDWVHENIRFQYGTSTPLTTAKDVYESGVGVCRDFTHLGISFCRAMNIPARYVFGYLPDIAVPPPGTPMDFCAWFEAWLGGRWYTFDPRNNTPRVGRAVIGRGRDALDVAMVTTYGNVILNDVQVWADEAVPRT
ncbi:MAG TPA: transglutaminase family protein [Candidatus Xenobia bacterium]|jgi:transglutaminase-like putative cysteine protease